MPVGWLGAGFPGACVAVETCCTPVHAGLHIGDRWPGKLILTRRCGQLLILEHSIEDALLCSEYLHTALALPFSVAGPSEDRTGRRARLFSTARKDERPDEPVSLRPPERWC